MKNVTEKTDRISITDFQIQQYTLKYTEEGVHRYTYSDEFNFMNNIRMGKPEVIKKNFETNDLNTLDKIGHFANSMYKQIEYMACSAFTKSCMAAIEGGLNPPKAYALSDLAKQKLEQCTTIKEMVLLLTRVMITYASLVAETQNDKVRSSHIEKCKNYIVNHLNVTFTLDDISREVGINKFYLSRLFAEKEGIGIHKYTLQKKMEVAANLLKYSESSIPAIASYLQFSSQSHFGKTFRDYYHMTPNSYRNNEKPAEFK